MRYFILFVASLLAIGCATVSLQGNVTRFHALEPGSRSFVILPENEQQGSLEFRTYAGFVSEKLRASGWREAPLETADVAIFVQYKISQGHRIAFNYPVFGSVPTGTTNTYGTVNTFGNTSTINATTTQQTTLGVVGTGTGSRTEYDRAVRMTMYSLAAYRQSQKLESVYEGEIRSTGSTGDLPTVMPALLDGLFQDFPGKSGTARVVSIPIR